VGLFWSRWEQQDPRENWLTEVQLKKHLLNGSRSKKYYYFNTTKILPL